MKNPYRWLLAIVIALVVTDAYFAFVAWYWWHFVSARWPDWLR